MKKLSLQQRYRLSWRYEAARCHIVIEVCSQIWLQNFIHGIFTKQQTMLPASFANKRHDPVDKKLSFTSRHFEDTVRAHKICIQ